MAELQTDIAEYQLRLKYAGEGRDTEFEDFQLVVTDQRSTAELLTGAAKKGAEGRDGSLYGVRDCLGPRRFSS